MLQSPNTAFDTSDAVRSILNDGPDHAYLTIPDAHLLFNAEFKRSGSDLALTGPDGQRVVVTDYFKYEKLPTLLSPEGAALHSEIVEALAGSQAPGQYAQAGAPATAAAAIGRVETVTGSATAVRNGVSVVLNAGDAVYKNDVVQTGSGSAVGIAFVDASAFNLSANGRMLLNEFVYDPNGTSNNTLLNLFQGAATFISGQVAKSGQMNVQTPSATMGIRGTVFQVEIVSADGRVNVSVINYDSNTHQLVIRSGGPNGPIIGVASNQGGMWQIQPTGPLQAIAQETAKTPQQLALEFSLLQPLMNLVASGQAIYQGPPIQIPTPPAPPQPGDPQQPTPQTSPPQGSPGGTPIPPGSGTPPAILFQPPIVPPPPTPPPPPAADPPPVIQIVLPPPPPDQPPPPPPNLAPAFISAPQNFRIASPDASHPHVIAPDMDATGRWVVFASANVLPGGSEHVEGDVYLFDRLNPDAAPVRLTDPALIAAAWGSKPPPEGETYGDNTASISLDGRFVVFAGKYMVDPDGEGGIPAHDDSTVYIYDRVNDELHVLREHAGNARVSGGGDFIALEGDSGNLGNIDALVIDQDGQIRTAVSANAEVLSPDLNATGRYITFETPGTEVDITYLGLDGQNHTDHFIVSNFVTGLDGLTSQIYLYDRVTHTLEMVSSSGGAAGNGNSGALNFGSESNENDWHASLSADGRYVAFQSNASNLLGFHDEGLTQPVDSNGVADVFVYDRIAHTITRVSVDSSGTQGNGASYRPEISPDGRYVVFASDATNLAGDDTNGVADTFVYDLQNQTVRRVSQDFFGEAGNGNSSWGDAISGGAIFVAFGSEATNLADNNQNGVIDEDTNNASDIIFADLSAGKTGLVMEDAEGDDPLATHGKLGFTDLDHNTASAVAVGTAWGTFDAKVTSDTVGANDAGIVTWEYQVDDAMVQQLAFGERHIDTFKVTLTDTAGNTAFKDVSIITIGVNDKAIVTDADTKGDIEDTSEATGQIDFTDVDLTDAHTATAFYIGQDGPGKDAALGKLDVKTLSDTTKTGVGGEIEWTYKVNPQDIAFLGADETRTEHFVVRIGDGAGFVNQDVTITLHGENDDPLIAAGTTSAGHIDAVPVSNAGTAFTQVAQDYLTVIGPALVNGLGSVEDATAGQLPVSSGFGEHILARNDDQFTKEIDITGVFGPEGLNFFGKQYTSLYINNNGNITFTAGSSDYTPDKIDAGFDNPIIAAFWADVDTRAGKTNPGADGNSTGSNLVYYDLDTVNHVLTVTWDDVGQFSNGTVPNAFQLQLVGLDNGEFAIVYRYEDMQWSGGGRAGYSNGSGEAGTFFEFPQSGTKAIADLDDLVGNTGLQGIQVFFTNGASVVPANLAASGVINFTDVDLSDVHSASADFQGDGDALGSLSLSKNSDTTGTGKDGQFAWHYTVDPHDIAFLAGGKSIDEVFLVNVSDDNGGQAQQAVTISLTGVNDAPIVENAIADQSSTEDAPWSFQLPADAFADVDQGTTLTYQATLANGAALPIWLSFDAETGTFSGTPPDDGVIELKVTASDGTLSASDTFTLTVEAPPENQAPVIAEGDVSLTATEGQLGPQSGTFHATDAEDDALAWSIDGGSKTNADYFVMLDDLKVVRNGTEIFHDAFDDGAAPPSASKFSNGSTASYFTDAKTGGTFVEDLDSGRLVMAGRNTSEPFDPAFGGKAVHHTATLNTSTNPESLLGLGKGSDFTVEARFDLSLPQDPLEYYGIRLNDGINETVPNDISGIFVRHAEGEDGPVEVVFVHIDRTQGTSGTFTVLDQFVLDAPAGVDQIVLRLTHDAEDQAGTDVIHASFDLLDNGVIVGSTTVFTTTDTIFHGEDWTRAQIVATSPVEDDQVFVSDRGVLYLDEDGNWQYNLRNGRPEVQQLAEGETAQDHFTVQVSDGNGGTTTRAIDVTITGKNDAPVIVLPGPENETEAFAGTPLELSGATLTDLDTGDVITVTVQVAHGTLTPLGDGAGLTSVSGSGAADDPLTIVGSAAAVSAALQAGVNYTADASFAGDDVLLLNASDNHGGADSESVTIHVQSDAPTIGQANASGTVTEDFNQYVLDGGFETGGFVAWALTGGPASGVGVPGVDGTAAHSGSFGADFGPTDTTSVLSQYIPTTAAQEYTLDFWLNPDWWVSPETFSVAWNGEVLSLGEGFAGSEAVFGDRVFNRYVFDVTGMAGSSHLEFSFVGPSSVYRHIDDVSVTGATPPAEQRAAGLINFADPDAADTHMAEVVPQQTGYLGSFQLDPLLEAGGGGTVAWRFAVDNSAIQFLAKGQTLEQLYDVTISDDQGSVTQTVTVSLVGKNDDPTTAAVTLDAIAEDSGARTITQDELLGKAADVDSANLAAVDLKIASGGGMLDDLGDGKWSYTPAADDDGSVSFSYTVTDGTGGTAAGSATLDITPENDAPTTAAVTLDAIAEDSGARTITQDELLGKAADVDSANLAAVDLKIATGGGMLDDLGDGKWSYTPAADDDGSVSFSYTVTDGAGGTAAGSATLDITPENDDPTTAAVTLDAIAEDSGPRTITQDELLGKAADVDSTNLAAVDLKIATGGGMLDDLGDGKWSYTPAADDDGSVSFSYTVTDDAGGTAAGSATLDITPENDAPTTAAVTLDAIAEDSGARTITQAELLANAEDIDSDDLTATGLQIAAGNGELVDNKDGSWSYTPAEDDDSSVSFSYSITDGAGGTAAGSATLDITPVNDDPTTAAVTLDAIAEDSGPRTITQDELLGKAADVDSANLAAVDLKIATGGGMLDDLGDGKWTYTPAGNDDTSVSFEYLISDNDGGSVVGSATLDITPVNDDPTTAAVTLDAIAEDSGPRLITQAELLANAEDIDSDDLTATGLQIAAGNGELVDNKDGSWSYTPAEDDDSSVSFSYSITDGAGGTAAGSATLDITPVNDDPTTAAVTLDAIAEDSGARLITQAELLGNAEDIDSDDLTATGLQVAAGNGELVDNKDGSWSYTPAEDDDSSVSFSYSITDGAGGSVAGTATLDVTPVNDAPVAVDDSANSSEDGAPIQIAVLENDIDVDQGDAISVVSVDTAGTQGTVSIGGAVVGATLTHRYTFDGAAVTDLVGGVNGVLRNGASLSGGALQLDGVDDFVQLDGKIIPIDGQDFSVTLYALQPVTQSDYRELISQGSSGAPGFYIGQDPSHHIRVGDQFMSTGVSFPDDHALHFYALTSGASGTTLYIDGAVVLSSPTQLVVAGSDDTRIGAQFQTFVEFFGGTIDDVRVYSGVLTQEDVAAIGGGGGSDVTYSPGTAFQHLAAGATATDTFSYTIQDTAGAASSAPVTVTITGVNDAPVANDDPITNAAPPSGDGWVLNPDNGHYYRLVTGAGISWTNADSAASADGSYLATVTSSEENDFVNSLRGGFSGQVWLGGSDAAAEGTWTWVAGPEAGITFSNGNTPVGYANWFPGEPNNSGGGEHHLTFTYGNGADALWNDAQNSAVAGVFGYVEEWGGRPDDVSFAEDTDAAIASATLLANDTDVDVGDTLSVTGFGAGNKSSAQTAQGGTVEIDGGDIVYTPASNFNGADSFTYWISDGNGGSSSATVSVNVASTNDVPVFSSIGPAAANTEQIASRLDPDTNATVFDTELSNLTTANNVGYWAGAALTVSRQGGANAEDSFGFDTSVGNFSVQGNELHRTGGGAFATFTNAGGVLTVIFLGNVGTQVNYNLLVNKVLESITYTNTSDAPPASVTLDIAMNDGNAGGQGSGDAGIGTATVTVAITAANDAPAIAGDLVAAVGEGGTYTLTTDDLSFTDPDDDASGVTFSVSNPANGVIKVDGAEATTFTHAQIADGKVTFTHDGSETTSASFKVSAEDGDEDGSAPVESTFNLTVSAVNDAPVAVADAFDVAEDAATAVGDVLANDSDAEDGGPPLSGTVTGFTAMETGVPAGVIATAYHNGHTYYLQVQTNAGGQPGKWWSTLESEAVALGGHLVTVNDAAENQWLLDTFATTAINYANTNSLPDKTAVSFFTGLNDTVNEGAFVWASGEPITYTNWFAGEPNGGAGSDFGGILVNFATVGKWHDISNTTGATDLPFGIVEVPGLVGASTTVNAGQDITLPGGAVLSVAADGQVTLDQNHAYDFLTAGQTYDIGFSYTLKDSGGLTDLAAGKITITGINDAPVANDDANLSAAFTEDTPASIFGASLLGNDTDADTGNALAITGLGAGNTATASTAQGGTVELVNGNIVYTAKANYNGPDSFVYHAADYVSTGNLIVNPDAESGLSDTNFVGPAVPPQGWITTNGFSAVDYAIGGVNDLNAADSAAVGGAQSYFSGGPDSAVSTATQTVDVSGYAAAIDGGSVKANLSGYFGGWANHDDDLVLTAQFLSATSEVLGQTEIGGYQAAARANTSQLLFDSELAAVPVGTRSVELVMTATRLTNGPGITYDDGYADNLSLRLLLQPEGASDTATVSFNVASVNDAPAAQAISAAATEGGAPVALQASYTDGDFGDAHRYTLNTTGTAGTVTFLPGSGPNLIVNGSFETQDGTNSARTFTAGVNSFDGIYWNQAATVFGWGKSTAWNFELDTNNNDQFFQVSDGMVAMDLNFFPNQNSQIFQDISGLTAGDSYRLMFDAAQFRGAGGTTYTGAVEAWWNGVKVATVTPSGSAFATTVIDVVAAATGSGADGAQRVEFREVGNASDGVGTMLDNVRLFSVGASDPTFSYDPNFQSLAAGQSTTTFTYTVTDAAGAASTATATVNVTAVNDAPVNTVAGLENRVNVADDATLRLNDPVGVTTAVVGGTTYLFVAGQADDGLSVFSVAASGALTNVANVTDGGTLELDGAWGVTTAAVGGTTYLFASGFFDDGLSVFSVAASGALTNVANVTDGGTLELDGATDLTTATIGGTTYLFVTAETDDGVSVFSVAANGALTNVTNVTDNVSLELDGSSGITTAVVGGTTYLFVAGRFDDGVSVFSVDANGALTNVANVSDNTTLQLNDAFDVATAAVGGTTYLFTTGIVDNGISVFSVAASGALTNVFNVTDNTTLELLGAVSLAPVQIGGATYLFVIGQNDDGMSVFSVDANGALTNVANVTDNATLELDGALLMTTATVGGNTYAFVGGYFDDGLSSFAFQAHTINEDGNIVFNSANGNAISISDVDVGTGTETVTLAAANGALTLGSISGLSFTTGDGTSDTTMTFSGTVSQINTALSGLSYAPLPDFNGSDALTITTNDNGNTGTDPGLTDGPTAEQDIDTVAITVNSINDAPVASDITIDVNEDGPAVAGVASFTDPDAGDTHVIARAQNLIVNGSFEDLSAAGDGGSAAYVGTSNPFNGVNWRDTPTLVGWERDTAFQFELVKHNNVISNATGPVISDMEVNVGGQNQIIYQDIAGLTADHTYRLMFDTSKFMNFTATLDVYWNDDKIATVTPTVQSFVTTVLDVEAIGGTNQLEFREVGAGTDGVGTALDNVQLYDITDALLYDPAGGFEQLAQGETATDSVDYVVIDAVGKVSNVATADVTINGQNDAPTTNDTSATGSEDVPAGSGPLNPGSEFVVNTLHPTNQSAPSVAALDNGNIVVAWVYDLAGADGSGTAIRARVLDPGGNEVVAEFLVNQQADGVQAQPSVTALGNGGFVVTWLDASPLGDGDGYSVKGRLFDASGGEVTPEFVVNEQVIGDQYLQGTNQIVHSVAGLEGGGFVVTWTDGNPGSDGSGTGVKARVFDALGNEVVSEFAVNTVTNGHQYGSTVAALDGGGFVVAWHNENIPSPGGDDSNSSIKARVFDALGNEVVPEFLVNVDPGNGSNNPNQLAASAAGLDGGGFVITWESWTATGGDTSGSRVSGRVFDASGAGGSEFLVNEQTAGAQFESQVARLDGGGFVVTWRDDGSLGVGSDGSSSSVKARVFDGEGNAAPGGEMLVNQTVAFDQRSASVSGLDGGGFVVTWNDFSAGASIRARVFEEAHAVAVELSGSDVDGTVASFKIADLPANGALYSDPDLAPAHAISADDLVSASGNAATVYFKPDADWNGSTSFHYAAVDNNGAQDTTPALASITIDPINDEPTIDGDSSGAVVAGNPLAPTDASQLTVSDPDTSDTHTWTIDELGASSPHLPDYHFTIDHFTVARTGDPGLNFTFDDTFDSSDPAPPDGPDFGGPLPYSVFGGTFDETGDRAVMDGTKAGLLGNFVSAGGSADPAFGQIATLRTTIADGSPNGLRSDADFTVTGLFDLTLPEDSRTSYGIRLSDRLTTTGLGQPTQAGDDVIELALHRGQNGFVGVELREVDFVNGDTTVLAKFDLSAVTGFDQIRLSLTHDDANQGVVHAFYELGNDGGAFDAPVELGTAQIFGTETAGASDDEDWTLAAFFARTPEMSDSVLQGTYGTFTLTQAGAWNYTLDNSDPDTQALAEGEHATDEFVVKVDDGHGGFDTETVAIDVAGKNDAPVLTLPGNADSLDEDSWSDLTGAHVVDPDNGAVLTASLEVAHGTLTPLGSGDGLTNVEIGPNWINITGPAAAVDAAFNAGVKYTPDPDFSGEDQLQIVVGDEQDATDNKSVTITVNNVNDTPMVTGASATGSVPNTVISAIAASYLTAGNDLIDGLGGTPEFGENTFAANDDGSFGPISLAGVFGESGLNFFGTNYLSLYINNNGNVTFTGPSAAFDPLEINGGLANPIIAPYWADVDTRGGATSATPGGNSTGSNLVYYDIDPDNHVLTITWDDVGYFSLQTNKLNAFQLQLIGYEDGDFDIVFRYEDINWTTGSFHTSGGVNGLGGNPARAGYSDGQGTAFELEQSGNQASMLALEETLGNTGIPGVFVFQVRNGVVTTAPVANGEIEFTDVDPGDTHTASSTKLGQNYLGTFALDPVDDEADTLAWHFSLGSDEINTFFDPLASQVRQQFYDVTIDDGSANGTVTQRVGLTVATSNSDTFIFAPGSGQEVVFGFTATGGNTDIIDLSESEIDVFEDLLVQAINNEHDAHIDLGNGDSITLLGVQAENVKASHFIFQA